MFHPCPKRLIGHSSDVGLGDKIAHQLPDHDADHHISYQGTTSRERPSPYGWLTSKAPSGTPRSKAHIRYDVEKRSKNATINAFSVPKDKTGVVYITKSTKVWVRSPRKYRDNRSLTLSYDFMVL
ncbi:MAG TPA: hypothetical protein ENH87_13860 [Pricia antarctica]|uniref:Uncharacterized protein n=1 Tax=Pricia antarctica TaxID=641691 RepID=A0A831QRK1_9FLAO|nr:hypothetical protein [Pricia antarctica]